jgi:hypothetical protein
MKKFNLILLIVLFVFLFSCAGKPKVKPEENNEQTKESVVEKTDKPAVKTDESAVEKQAPVDLTVATEEKPKDTPTDVSADKSMEEPIDEKITQAEFDKELIADAAASSNKTEIADAQEHEAKTPSALPAPSSQAQSQTQPQTQTQTQAQPQAQSSQTQPSPQTTTPQSNQPAPSSQAQTQPPSDEKTDSSETASSDDDSQDKKESAPSITSGNSAPATRIESLAQMGTMPYDKEIIFSRIVRATVGQIVEIPFRGNGWVYLGELTSQRGIVFSSRRNDSDGQSFVFALEEQGTYALKFYRQDFIRDYIINDHVQVVVGEAPSAGAGWFKPPAERERIVAQPRWPSMVEETQIRNGTRPASEPVVTTAAAEPAKDTASQQKPASAQETRTPQRTSPTRETNPADRTPSQNTPSSSATGGQTPATTQITQQEQTATTAQVTQSGQTMQQGQTAATGQTMQTGQPTSATTAEQGGGESPSVEKREKLAPEVLLQKAKESFEGGNIAAAIALLEQFKTDYPGGSDEAFWQLGQYYEANSPSRNILLSLDNYRRLVNEYPQSGRFNDARRRIAYLERYYINIQ